MLRVPILLITLSMSLPSVALDFEEYQAYEPEQRYYRGQVVSQHSHLWVSRFPSRNKEPKDHPFRWGKVEIEDVQDWRRNRFYPIGSVVEFRGDYYFAKDLTLFRPNSYFGRRHWQKFNHPAIGYDLPVIDREEAREDLHGIDRNRNGLRDDYEVYVIMNHPSQEMKDLGFEAGRLYTEVMSLIDKELYEISYASAESMMNRMLDMSACVRLKVRAGQSKHGFHSAFYNTKDRILSDFRSQYKLHDILGDNFLATVSDTPCEEFSYAVRKSS
ncbi:hypothetical protein [Ferrimonas balearica]|uniref:hypothetical protein n=1 Tax=Ferrimonas balearica TaxID=44012 RepID=UPI001C93A9EA|nr:hypothetical protein [Ferrimonas balearica]MBY5979980.1 hypothetical protein [Ferrimonas balearica]